MHSLAQLAEGLRETEMVVAGDLMLDRWIEGSAHRLDRDGPVPVVDVRAESAVPGGAANTAANAARLGGKIQVLGAVGDDDDSDYLLDQLQHLGVDTERVVRVPGRTCTTKTRVVAGGQLVARFDSTSERLPPVTERRLVKELADLAADGMPILMSDYRSGLANSRLRSLVGDLRDRGLLLVVDGHDPRMWSQIHPSVVLPDWAEVRPLLGPVAADVDRAEVIMDRGDQLLEACGCDLVVVTLDRDGAVLLEPGRPPFRAYADYVRDAHGTGAGDTFAAGFTLALASGADPPSAVELATVAASISVRTSGTSTCSAEDLQRRLSDRTPAILDLDHVRRIAAELHAEGHRIVLTNGCFDILHRGHVAYLNEAKRCGDVLIVGLNDDPAVTRLKGPGRPINSVRDRAVVLASLSCVDHLAVFGGDDARELVVAVLPDVYVKGGDYECPEDLIETEAVRALGGEVRLLSYTGEHSTSKLVDRIHNLPRVDG